MAPDKPQRKGSLMDDDDRPMTRGQVARRLNVSPERVRQLTAAGRLTCQHTPLGRLYDRQEVERLAAARRPQASAPTAADPPDDR